MLKYKLMEAKHMTIEYAMLHAIEAKGPCTSIQLRGYLRRYAGIAFSQAQASGALQRLRKDGLVAHDGRWALAGAALAGSSHDVTTQTKESQQ